LRELRSEPLHDAQRNALRDSVGRLRILFDIVHPADVHLFRATWGELAAAGDEVVITSRHKDVTVRVLDELGVPHEPISAHGGSVAGLGLELVRRDLALVATARRRVPDVFVANNSPCATHAAFVLRRPSVVFEDTEIHRLNHLLYYPFVTEVHSPASYRKRLGRKHHLYRGYHALAYLHPKRFTPDADVVRRCGVDPTAPYIVVRLVDWRALHDVGMHGIGAARWMPIVDALARRGRIIVSAEGPLPPEMQGLAWSGPASAMHHLLAFASGIIGESATMCAEAAMLGVPAVLVDALGRGYTDELETRYGLCFRFPPERTEAAAHKLETLLTETTRVRAARAKLLADSIELVEYQLEIIRRLARR
jgi:hypothetical protein